MQAILDRFEQIAELLNEGQLDAAESAMRIHDRAVRAAFMSAVPPDPAMAQRLDIHEGKEYLRLHCLRLEEQTREPIAVTEMLIPVRTGVPTEKLLEVAGAARALAKFLDPTKLSRVEQVFDAASFEAADAKLLDIKKSEPAMRVQRRYRDANGRLLLIATSLHPPGRFAYSMVLSRNHR